MQLKARSRLRTFDEFCVLVKDGQKADLIDGVIYMASPDSLETNNLFMWFGGLIEYYAEETELGEVFGSRAAFRLDNYNSPEPDLAFVRASRLPKVKGGHFNGAPDIAIELVSLDSVERDYVAKREKYRQAGVSEYWIVDEMVQRVTMLRLDARGRYREVKPQAGVLFSEVLAGFWFRPEWLWRSPLPKKLAILNQILAGPPGGPDQAA